MIDPQAAARNFERLEAIGARGRYGFYEALDFTPARVPEGEHVAIVRAFMAHHQGMTIIAIADALLDGVMREPLPRRADRPGDRAPAAGARAARRSAAPPSVSETMSAARIREIDEPGGWRTASPWSATPDTQLLSNGRYTVMLTAAGSGYSAWRDLAVTRWREDATCDDWGSYVFLRDVASGEVWSAAYSRSGPSPTATRSHSTRIAPSSSRRDGTLATTLGGAGLRRGRRRSAPRDDLQPRRSARARSR